MDRGVADCIVAGGITADYMLYSWNLYVNHK